MKKQLFIILVAALSGFSTQIKSANDLLPQGNYTDSCTGCVRSGKTLVCKQCCHAGAVLDRDDENNFTCQWNNPADHMTSSSVSDDILSALSLGFAERNKPKVKPAGTSSMIKNLEFADKLGFSVVNNNGKLQMQPK
jgi:hypothetical protein